MRAFAVLVFLICGAYSSAAMASEQDDADEQFNLGLSHLIRQDYAEAAKWFRLAAEQGDAEAQYNLGLLYSNGQGVPQDYVATAKWFRLAAEQGHTDAQSNLGVLYASGQGVPQDYVEAHKWFNLAAASGGESAGKNRDTAASLMTPAQIAEAQKLAREWMAARSK